MAWHHPLALLLLLAVPLGVWLLVGAARQRRAALAAFGTAEADGPSALRRAVRGGLVVTALALLALALAGPRYGTELREVSQDGLDMLIVLDVSRSMLAEDVAPNRLDRARFEIERQLDGLRGSRIGIVLFANEAFLQMPLTTDFGALRTFLGAADPSLIPNQGTDIGAALDAATQTFAMSPASEQPRARVVLLVSDGEDHADRYGPALRRAEEAGIVLYAVGVGETEGATFAPSVGSSALHRDEQGQVVRSRLDEGVLRQIARSGAYFRIGRDGSTLDGLPGALARLDRSTLASERFGAYAERFQVPLAVALLLLLLEPLLPVRRRKPVAA